MARVLGVGGVFFKAQDPDAVRAWYAGVLGVEAADWGGVAFEHPDRGAVVWTPFPSDTRNFEPSAAPFMINFIVDDLDGVLARAAERGVEPIGRQEADAFGRFAWLLDPAGVKIELWQPD